MSRSKRTELESADGFIASGHSEADLNGLPRAELAPAIDRAGDEFRIAWTQHRVECVVTAIHENGDGVHCELAVSHDGTELHWGRLGLSSTTARAGVVRKLAEIEREVPWRSILERTCRDVALAVRVGEPLVTLTGQAASPARELVPRLLFEGEPTGIHADGDTGKSLFAMALGMAVHSGLALPCGLVPARAVPVAYLDWETSPDSANTRLGGLAAGRGIEPPRLLYKRMTRPLVTEARTLAAEFARRGVGFIIIDSMVFALAGGDGAAFHEPVTAFYGSLRLFAPAASLVLNYVTNADARSGAPARPYGGAFAFNGPRLVWEAKRDLDVTDATAMVFTCRKANNLPRRPDPFGLRFAPRPGGAIDVAAFDLAEAATQTTAGVPLPQRITRALGPGALTAAELADHLGLGVKEDTVGRILRRLRDKGRVVQIGEDKPFRWGLAAR